MERKLVVGPYTLKIDAKTWDRLIKYELVRECNSCKDDIYHPINLAATLIAVAGVKGQDIDTVCRTIYHQSEEHKEDNDHKSAHDTVLLDDLDNLFN